MKKFELILGKKEIERLKDMACINTNMTFEIKFLPCTNTKGNRIKIKNINTKDSVIIDYRYDLKNNINFQAALYVAACGYKITGITDNLILTEWNSNINLTY